MWRIAVRRCWWQVCVVMSGDEWLMDIGANADTERGSSYWFCDQTKCGLWIEKLHRCIVTFRGSCNKFQMNLTRTALEFISISPNSPSVASEPSLRGLIIEFQIVGLSLMRAFSFLAFCTSNKMIDNKITLIFGSGSLREIFLLRSTVCVSFRKSSNFFRLMTSSRWAVKLFHTVRSSIPYDGSAWWFESFNFISFVIGDHLQPNEMSSERGKN